ncbi:inorganic phosphate transporter [Nitrososphaera viennensis]|uniref:Inorganic phosphate transporter n=2 Tax=Nitrososphaera viennensis TaxID=1034015 RepID=A0A977ID64_9ARCH|nr:inorganic phosphate transporter [Nitrososphaera viennensis]AIC16917.1 putative inorganic phosphate transporter [Nitrososphaera viennensis EN76]UVS68821.1 inorganic phosphate transporter [Nitrososphaera viennensis]
MADQSIILVVYGAIGAALFFDFVNGFHDAANSIATVVGTRVLRPLHAVGIAAAANFTGPFIFGTAVAATVGKGIIMPEFSTVDVILAGLLGAIAWDLITWWFGLPSSSSHALIGGLVGSALFVGGLQAVVFSGVEKVLTFMVVSPAMGFAVAGGFALAIMFFLRRKVPGKVNRVFGRLQIASSAFFSLTHGANDGQKTMGIITALLIAGGLLNSKEFVVPLWVIISAAAAIALGTFFGGWRIVKTMAFRLTNLKPYQGFCAETGGGAILTSMAWLGIPVSTTHAISGAIMGVGATKRFSAVRWGLGKRIIYAWVITIPASAAIAAACMWAIKALTG